LRKAKVRALLRLPDAVEEVFSTVTSLDGRGWFLSSSYVR